MDKSKSSAPRPTTGGTESEDPQHGCYDGVVFVGHLVEDSEAGEEVEVFESVPCRRCAGEAPADSAH